MSSRELAEWVAFDRLEPLDHAQRAEVSNARLLALIMNALRKKDDTAVEWQTLMPQYGEETREQTWQEQMAMFDSFVEGIRN